MSKHLLVIGSCPSYNAMSVSVVPFHKIGGKDFCCVTDGGPVLLWEMETTYPRRLMAQE